MKYLIWLLVILLAIWAFKRSRRINSDAPKAPPPGLARQHGRLSALRYPFAARRSRDG